MAAEAGQSGSGQTTATSIAPPPNGGFQAWIQVLAAHFLFFNSCASEISWIGTFQAFLLVAFSLVAGPVFDRGHFRSLIVVGTFLSVFGTMMTSLATKYWEVFLAQGLCVGLGTGSLFLPSVAIVATYFSTKRALAIGFVASGGSIGSVIYPIVFHRLQPRLGFPWAMRVLGFIILATSILFSIGLFLAFAGLYIPIFYIIIYAKVHGHIDVDLSFYLIAILNGASAFGRILAGQLADRYGALEMTTVFTISSAILAYIAITANALGGLIAFSVVYGFLSGAVVSLPNAVVAGLAPNMSLVGTWMGMSFFCAAVGILVGNPIAGCIINVPQDQFAGGFIFSGSLVMAAGVAFVMAKTISHHDKHRHTIEKVEERASEGMARAEA